MARLTADFSAAFSRDIKKKAKARMGPLGAGEGHRFGCGEQPRFPRDASATPQHARVVGELVGSEGVPCRQRGRLARHLVLERQGCLLRADRKSRRAIQIASITCPAEPQVSVVDSVSRHAVLSSETGGQLCIVLLSTLSKTGISSLPWPRERR